ncbi:hypothetical protein HGRIS_010228 [Hohenbuehelia grisea]|uniref:Btz domain-containing protein n=1 Tax=Hohenbuehelia grisea TaxID=104357 RepID=A0ABR3J3N9_9AGAR
MPAPITTISPSTARPASKARGRAPPKKTRLTRRRGRGKGEFDSDEEIERAVGTDSESDDDLSSLDSDSATDSDTEPASEDVISNGRARVLTPNTNQSAPEDAALLKDVVTETIDASAAFFGHSTNWSEMVADENVHGPSDLPVIDFADFGGERAHVNGTRPSKPPKQTKPPSPVASPASVVSSLPEANEEAETSPVASTSHQPPRSLSPKRGAGQTARQAYQKRLENDPSFVPKVGEFWGHDDRLLEKDLRSLSGWWRGRWQGRGRGRGGFSMRGRGGYLGPARPQAPGQDDGDNVEAQDKPDVAPIERAWTHDGFEEMKRKEEIRQQQKMRGGFGNLRGGRGGPVAGRGRGGGVISQPPKPRSHNPSPFHPPADKPWFVMKPERVWTKQYDGFLYLDPAMKPRPGQGPAFNVKLPGSDGTVIRASLSKITRSVPSAKIVSLAPEFEPVVSLPQPGLSRSIARKEQMAPLASVTASVPAPQSSVQLTAHVGEQSSSEVAPEATSQPSSLVAPSASDPPVALESQTEELSTKPSSPVTTESSGWIQPDEVFPPERLAESDQHTALPPLLTTFTPPIGSPPPFGSPYAVYTPAPGPTLPPGIALNQHGMPYELATGRPVYLPAPAPLPVVYDHRGGSMIPASHHGMGLFVPGHTPHASMGSPDLLATAPPLAPTPPIGLGSFVDPSTGAPLFSFPRQSTRVEIRTPDGRPSVPQPQRTTSGLRSGATSFEPACAPQPMTASAPTEAEAEANAYSLMGEQAEQGMMDMGPYSPYAQQQYYYPSGYGQYPSYMDMGAGATYDYYGSPDARQIQGTVKYESFALVCC